MMTKVAKSANAQEDERVYLQQWSPRKLHWTRATVSRRDGLTLYYDDKGDERAVVFRHCVCGSGGSGAVSGARILASAKFAKKDTLLLLFSHRAVQWLELTPIT